MSMFYIHLQSTTMEPCSLQRDSYAAAKGTWLCGGCCSPRPGEYAIDAYIQERQPVGPMSFVNGCSLPMVNRAFLMRFGRARVERDLLLGQVFGPDGGEIRQWITFRGRQELIVRGTEHVQHRICEECGRNLYFAMGKRYLYPKPRADINLFESNLFGLIVPEWLAVECDMVSPSGVTAERLEVLREPLDGLAGLTF